MHASIIIPCYNCEQYICETIKALFSQDLPSDFHFEVVIVNDGSTDNTLNLLQELANRFDNLSIHNIENSGVSYARNHGISKAKNEWIVFLDSDDFCDLKNLSSMIYFASGHELDVVLANFVSFSDNPKKFSSKGDFEIYSTENYVVKSLKDERLPFAFWTGVYRRDFLLNKGVFFDKKTMFAEDQLFLIECLSSLEKIGFFSGVSYYYRVGHRSSSSQAIISKLNSLKYLYEKLSQKYNLFFQIFIERRVLIWIFNTFLGSTDLLLIKKYTFLLNEMRVNNYYSHMVKHASIHRLILNIFLLLIYKVNIRLGLWLITKCRF